MKFITHEIGSLAKPGWRVKAFSGASLTDEDLQEAESWGECLEIPEREKLAAILSKRQAFSSEEKAEIMRFASFYAIRLLEKAGLDLVWDGEQHRVEMYEYAVKHIAGFTFQGHVRSFDNKYYRKASCVERPELKAPYHVDEYREIARLAKKQVKIPLTGAYTIVDWSYDEYFSALLVPGKETIREERHQARKEFATAVAEQIIYPNVKALCEEGAGYIQIDEPAAATRRMEIDDFVNAVAISIGDQVGKAFFTLHICFSDYRWLFPKINDLQGILNEIHLEYANRDSKEPGVSAESRPGYAILSRFKDNTFKVGLGVLDVHSDFIEPPELVRDRVLYACEVLGDPERLFVASDCGLRTRSWDVAFKKLRNMVEGCRLAANRL
ncbi:MAG: hypothetical protein LLG04_00930 [Parachlamydia sp.]|nr:hypothetical protein [Parachlamydia sp.]